MGEHVGRLEAQGGSSLGLAECYSSATLSPTYVPNSFSVLANPTFHAYLVALPNEGMSKCALLFV